jgi:hypothetical protein
MPQITLNSEQAKLYRQATEPVQICDVDGKLLCTLTPPLTPEYIAELKRRAAAPGPWYSGQDVQEMFRFLEETWAKEGSFDVNRLNQLLDEFETQHRKAS